MPSINRNSSQPYYQQVYEQIVRGIEQGFYPAGKKLPSIRECARELGVSNTTIELAYQRLVEEGYVTARRGSGYTICELDVAPANDNYRSDEYREAVDLLSRAEMRGLEAAPAAFDFAYDDVDASLFPYTAWARTCREVFFASGADSACLYNDRQGLAELREQVSLYLNSEYSIGCTADQILIMPSTRYLVSEILALYEPKNTVFAMEEPGYDEVGKRLSERGYTVRPFPVHPFPAWDDVEHMLEGADIAFVTPACQFPSNRVMPVDIREALVEWASRTGAYIIDDEYGWEFQSGMARTPSLGALDKEGRVITLGTFSNSFTPAVCLSYAVLPPQLMLRWREMRRDAHPQVPWQTQAAMAAFMREGLWRVHIRRIRTSMLKKRQVLSDSLQKHLGGNAEVVEGLSSLFMLVKVLDGRSEAELIEAAAKSGVRVYPTSRYWSGTMPADWNYILVGYAGIPIDDIETGVKALARAWGF